MIRFRCPTCDREYVLPDALAGLPLLCKGCGQRLTPPDPQPDPEPEPPPPVEPAPVSAEPEQPARPSSANPGRERGGEAITPSLAPGVRPDPLAPTREMKVAAERKKVEPQHDGTAPAFADPIHNKGDDPPRSPPPALPRPVAPPDRRLVGLVVDAALLLILLAGGVVLGEMAAGRSTRELVDATAAAGSPPPDLVMWAAPPALLLLFYLGLGSRGRTVGGWLRRRAG